MLRRFAVAHACRRFSGATLSSAPGRADPVHALRAAERRSTTAANAAGKDAASATENAAAAKTAPAPTPSAAQRSAGGKAGSASTAHSHGPQRKDWRTHKDIVYVKGVPAKGSMFKLPWSEQFIIYLVFSLAGAGAVYLVRPQIHYLCYHGFLGLTEEAGWVKGPWLFRVLYVLIMFPCYSAILFAMGSFFGRRIWFSFMIHKMWSRFLTKKASQRLAYVLDIQHY